MAEFNKAYAKTSAYEGHYVNDPDDPGGETWKGIARKYNGEWQGWSIIDHIKSNNEEASLNSLLNANAVLEEAVVDLYKTKYWDTFRGDEIKSEAIANIIYDIKVNGGKVDSWLQRILNTLNRKGEAWPDISVDGKLGPNTIRVLNTATDSPEVGPRIVEMILSFRTMYFIERTEANKNKEKYINGWINRVITERKNYQA